MVRVRKKIITKEAAAELFRRHIVPKRTTLDIPHQGTIYADPETGLIFKETSKLGRAIVVIARQLDQKQVEIVGRIEGNHRHGEQKIDVHKIKTYKNPVRRRAADFNPTPSKPQGRSFT